MSQTDWNGERYFPYCESERNSGTKRTVSSKEENIPTGSGIRISERD